MRQDLHTELLEQTNALRSKLALVSLSPAVWHAWMLSRAGPKMAARRFGLLAPAKQSFFLLGLLLTSPEPQNLHDLSSEDWLYVHKLLKRVLELYALMFFPNGEEAEDIDSSQWREPRRVAMPVFLDYYSQFDLSSVEQIQERIRLIHCHFENDLQALVGLSASEVLTMADWVTEEVGERVASIAERFEMEVKARSFRPWLAPEDPLGFDRRKMEGTFGEHKVEAFWRLLTSVRGNAEFSYLTETNPAERRPLFQAGPDTALCPSANALYRAVDAQLSDALLKSPLKKRFLRRRDIALEKRVEKAFRSYLGPGAQYWVGTYETCHADFEHDLVVKLDRDLLVIESKASPPREPLRDPEKAFVRIRDDFRSDKGIQKAYDQGRRLENSIARGEDVRLFDEDGVEQAVLSASELDHIWCICVTEMDYGALSTELSLLLKKEPEASYPWAVCASSLEAFLNALKRRNWGAPYLIKYLNERRKLHGRLIGNTDELEIAGVFLLYGTLTHLIQATANKILISPEYRSIFDQLWVEGQGGPRADFRLPHKHPLYFDAESYSQLLEEQGL